MAKKKSKHKSKKVVIIIVLLLLIILGVGYFIFSSKGIKDIFEYKNKIIIEVGDDIPTLNDFLYKDTLEEEEIIWDNLVPDENNVYKLGKYIGKFTYKGEEKTVTLIIQDTTSPVIEGVKDTEMLAYEKEPDLLEGIKVFDNSGEDLKAEVQGDYDIETPNEYVLYYVVKDSSGNETKKEFKFTVKENKDVTISKTSKGNKIKNYHGITYIDNLVVVNKTYGLPSNFAPNNLVTINGYIKVVDYVRDAFNELKSDSASIGFNIYASSGYRSYKDQDYIYNNYVRMDGVNNADTYSARAGHSEHQTGLVLDLNTVDSSFENTNESNWLKENCYKYGFIIRFPKGKESITGYMYEPWHIRYVGKSLAEKLYNKGDWLTIEEYYGIDSKYS